MARGDDTFQEAAVRVGAVAFLALVAGIVLAWPVFIPVAAALVGGIYAAELAIADAPLDVAAPAVAAGLFLSAELAYWSLDESARWRGEAGDSLRRAAFVALLAAAAFLVASLLLVLVDAVRARGVALDLVGAAAAAAAIAAVLVIARAPRQSSNGS
jgi:hypothetical protein